MKILLSDASGLTSRQVATILGRKGHIIHVLSPPAITLTKFTRWVKRAHVVPPFGRDPYAWLEAALSVLRGDKFDLLICTQEQVAIISAEIDAVQELGVKVAVPDFVTLQRVMDKISACETLRQASLPQPESMVFQETPSLTECETLLPGYIKTPTGTASTGVKYVATTQELSQVRAEWAEHGIISAGSPLLLQKETIGSLFMVSAVFSHGTLVAWHACVRAREGVGGGASKKVSLPMPVIQSHLQNLGKSLQWHGGLSMDAIVSDGLPSYIDINPRIVEPMNAMLAGVDLVDALIHVSFSRTTVATPPMHGIEGVESHQLVLALVEAATRSRAMLVAELFKALMRFDQYAGSAEELTPMAWDPWSVLAVAAVFFMLLVGGGGQARKMSTATIGQYALSAAGWKKIVDREDGKSHSETHHN